MNAVELPSGVEYIMKKLKDSGYEAYIVGGAVRDSLLGYEPKDWDLATNATPDKVMDIFDKTIPTGEKFGTITVDVEGELFEVTTYRLETDYDGRRPNVVSFSTNLLDDLKRRDFTINAMALDLNGKLIDTFNGKEDLEKKVIRCVGNSAERINEDRLRALRAIRFANKYNFRIDAELYDVLFEVSIDNLSVERIREEFNKILFSDTPVYGFFELEKYGFLKKIFPEFDEEKFNTLNKDFKILRRVKNDRVIRLSALFVAMPLVSKNTSTSVMKRLKYSNKEIEAVRNLVYKINYSATTISSLKLFINEVSADSIDDLFHLKIAKALNERVKASEVEKIFLEKSRVIKIIESGCPMKMSDLDISGFEIMELGYSGKCVGEILQELLKHVWLFPEDNYKEKLLFIIRMKG